MKFIKKFFLSLLLFTGLSTTVLASNKTNAEEDKLEAVAYKTSDVDYYILHQGDFTVFTDGEYVFIPVVLHNTSEDSVSIWVDIAFEIQFEQHKNGEVIEPEVYLFVDHMFKDNYDKYKESFVTMDTKIAPGGEVAKILVLENIDPNIPLIIKTGGFFNEKIVQEFEIELNENIKID